MAHPPPGYTGYTDGVKIAISLSDELYEDADRLARELGMNRSQLYARALEEFLAARREDEVTARLNELADELASAGADGAAIARRLIDGGQWEW